MEFELQEILDLNIKNVEEISTKYPCRLIKSGKITRINMAPNKFIYGGKMFIGSFVFEDDQLKHIFLMPIIEGIDIPNYPSEDYQHIKAEYCKDILSKLYGNKCLVDGDSSVWETAYGSVVVYEIKEGKDKYTGGNIRIDMR